MNKSLITIHYFNDVASSITGIMANLLAMYIVRRRTSKEMRQYSQTLMQNCTVDLFMNIVVFITKEQYETNDGMFILIASGFASSVPHPWDILLHMAYLFAVVFCLVSMVIPFYCRYRVFCKNDMLSNYRVFTLYFFASMIILSWSVLYAFSFIPDNDTIKIADILLKNSIFVKMDGSIPIYVATKIKNVVFVFTLIVQCGIMAIAYGLIIYFAINIHKTLKEKNGKFSKGAFKFHKEINNVLITQTIVPIAIGSFTVPLVIISAVLKASYNGLMLLDCMAISWICVVNPIFAIFMITHYRKAFFSPRKYLLYPVERQKNLYSISS